MAVDLRLVPAALTSWLVTAAGILWLWAGALAVLAVAVGVTAAVGWWAARRTAAEAPRRGRG
ncbi:competence protein, partial [Mycolicibacterium gilvum]|nr:competence protein [Mycolicibacterium gilvum]